MRAFFAMPSRCCVRAEGEIAGSFQFWGDVDSGENSATARCPVRVVASLREITGVMKLSSRAVKLAPTVTSQVENRLSPATSTVRFGNRRPLLARAMAGSGPFGTCARSSAGRSVEVPSSSNRSSDGSGQALGSMTPTLLQELYDRLLYNTDTAQGCADSAFVTLGTLRGRLEPMVSSCLE